MKILVVNGANADNPTETGSTPLKPACYDGRFKIVKYLVDQRADVNTVNYQKHTCLMTACHAGHYEVVQYLLEKGADPERKSITSETALHYSAWSGHFAISKLLAETGITMTKNNDGITPLMKAVLNSKTDMVEYLSSLSECGREDRIDALELLGTSFLFKRNSDILKSSHSFETAMQERYKDPDEILPKRVVPMTSILAITGKEECGTLFELEEIREDELALCIEALTIRERGLGTDNDELPKSLFYTGCLFADHDEYDKCIDLWLYASKLSQNIDEGVDVDNVSKLFTEMLHDGIEINFSSVMKCFQSAETELKLAKIRIQTNEGKFRNHYERDIVACIYLVGIMLMTNTSKEEGYQLYRAVYNFIQQVPQVQNGFTTLHMCCDSVTYDNTIDVKNEILFPNILYVKLS